VVSRFIAWSPALPLSPPGEHRFQSRTVWSGSSICIASPLWHAVDVVDHVLILQNYKFPASTVTSTRKYAANLRIVCRLNGFVLT
jgi:hypothetical protein